MLCLTILPGLDIITFSLGENISRCILVLKNATHVVKHCDVAVQIVHLHNINRLGSPVNFQFVLRVEVSNHGLSLKHISIRARHIPKQTFYPEW